MAQTTFAALAAIDCVTTSGGLHRDRLLRSCDCRREPLHPWSLSPPLIISSLLSHLITHHSPLTTAPHDCSLPLPSPSSTVVSPFPSGPRCIHSFVHHRHTHRSLPRSPLLRRCSRPALARLAEMTAEDPSTASTSPVPTVNFSEELYVLTLLVVQLLLFNGVDGVWLALLALLTGYLGGDLIIALYHFHIDNFKPDDPGYHHHLLVAKHGFHASDVPLETTNSARCVVEPVPLTILCAPGCRPCSPCSPAKKNSLLIALMYPLVPLFVWRLLEQVRRAPDLQSAAQALRQKQPTAPSIPLTHVSLLIMAPWITASTGALSAATLLAPVITYVVFQILNKISGAGIPDYYAHHRHQATAWIKLAQDLNLMMSPSTHHQHHLNTSVGYAYFCPLTNVVLEDWGLLTVVRWAMEQYTGSKAVPPPPSYE